MLNSYRIKLQRSPVSRNCPVDVLLPAVTKRNDIPSVNSSPSIFMSEEQESGD